MEREYFIRLRGILSLIQKTEADAESIIKIKEEIRGLKEEYPHKKNFLSDLAQILMTRDETSMRLFRILLESELLKMQNIEGSEIHIEATTNKNPDDPLSRPIQYIKGVGPALYERFKKKGLFTIRDALFFFPRNYEDRRNILPISHIRIGETVTVVGKVVCSGSTHKTFTITITDNSGFLDLVWFNIQSHYYEYLKNKFREQTTVIVSGKATLFRRNLQITHPVIKETSSLEDDIFFRRIIPIYSSIEGIGESHLIKIMNNIVEEYSNYILDQLPVDIKKRHNLIDLSDAIRHIHFPPNDINFDELQSNRWAPRKRLIFDELFLMELLLAKRKANFKQDMGISHDISDTTVEKAVGKLPFVLTKTQRSSLDEIISDLRSPNQMNRILIGDVGSGKTAVAMVSSYLVAQSGSQVAILVPTEILAQQHYRNFCRILPDIADRIGLLTGSTKGTERNRLLGDVALGHTRIIIGTHALLEEKIRFKNLTYVIIDEQHQFGINQRAKIKSKGYNVDLLMMSATPIPRTLAISLYGDLDISMIKELPPGRKEVITKIVRGDRVENLYDRIRKSIKEKGEQCYIVYPLISESDKLDLKAAEDMYRTLREGEFRDIPVGLIHGRMSDEEKDRIMNDFKSGSIRILIATTVIEVGIDVPTASIIVIEHAERFGLSQLHQLRGRVGRGERTSYCYLVAYNWLSENAYERLKIMEKTTNGFTIAEEDLKIRGPGELAGTRQSGLPDLHMSNLIRDAEILEETRLAAFEIIGRDPALSDERYSGLRTIINKREKELELITTS